MKKIMNDIALAAAVTAFVAIAFLAAALLALACNGVQ